MIGEKLVIDATLVGNVRAFHGHMCPGLAIGIRAAELALHEVGRHSEEDEVVAFVETDMCAVDAIQVLVGCTFGRGTLVHLDYGKNAFTFFRHSDGKGIRIVAKPSAFGAVDAERGALVAKLKGGTLSAEERKRYWQLQEQQSQRVLSAPLESLFDVKEPREPGLRQLRLNTSLPCEACGEAVMETRARRFEGKVYCLPCFERQALKPWPWAEGRAGC
jgi:formylmethanofuran dehydrogenase subunit E